ncbi:MAG: SpoIIE family protein phosphatase, partial [Oscillospiraceae bacterium]|nr:SpoIIE family protein phosphatase [Oscillospiraceae bacterium]
QCVNMAVAFVGAVGASGKGVSALIGCAVGYSVLWGFDDSAEYIASAVVIYTVSFVCQYSPIYHKRWFRIINVTLVLGITCAFGAVSSVISDFSYFHDLLSEIVCGSMCAFIYTGVRPLANEAEDSSTSSEILCFLMSLTTVICSCVRYRFLYELSLGNIICLSIVLLSGGGCGGVELSLLPLAMGIFITLLSENAASYMYICIIHTLLMNLFGVKHKFGSIVLLIGLGGFFSSTGGNFEWNLMLEIFAAALIFLLLPRKWLCLLQVRFDSSLIGEKVWTSRQLKGANELQMTELLTDTAQLLYCGILEYEKQATVDILRSSMERVCYDCANRDLCWTNHQNELLNILYGLEFYVKERGRVLQNDIPHWFSNYCPKAEMILGEMNFELRSNVEKTIYENRYNEIKKSVCALLERLSYIFIQSIDYSPVIDEECRQAQEKINDFCMMNKMKCSISVSRLKSLRLKTVLHGKHASRILSSTRILDELSYLLDMRLRAMKDQDRDDTVYLYEAEHYAVSVGAAVKRKSGEAVCGDYYSYLKMEDGCLYVILSDGMGAGEYAKRQSSRIVQLMERFLISDVQPMDAVHLVNMIISLYQPNQWDYATIDLFCVDLYTGMSELFKVGAAASYLKAESNIVELKKHTLCAGTIPAGELQIYHERFQMKPGDVLVMMSDGVIINDTIRLNEMIEQEYDSMKILARSILLESQQINRLDDDQTVLTVRMDDRL